MPEVGLVQRVPAVLAGVEQVRSEHAACVVDQNAHQTEFAGGSLQRRIDLTAVADIGDNAQGPNAFGGRRARFGIALPDCHLRAERGQSLRDAPSDALSPTGDDGDAPGQQDVRRIDGHPSS
jgi:hypothetical protein